MSSWRDRFAAEFRRAFDLGPKGPIEPTPEERELLDRILGAVVRRQLATPFAIFLESSRPMNGIGAQAMRFIEPIASTIVDRKALVLLADFLERRGSIEWLCRRLEELDAEHRADRCDSTLSPRSSDARGPQADADRPQAKEPS